MLSRQQPRDFYDLWCLTAIEGFNLSDYYYEFESKAKHKGLKPDSLESRIDKISPIFKSKWESSIKGQIKDLPSFEQVSRELGWHFRKLFKR